MSAFNGALRSTTWIVAAASLVGLFGASAHADLPCRNHYYVSEGESVETIAARCGTTVGDLIRANPSIEDPRALLVGQKLLMPRNAYVSRLRAGTAYRADYERGYGQEPGYTNADYSDNRGERGYRRFPEMGTYVVRPGDTLDDIAYDLGVSTYTLLVANPQIDDEDYLQIGERLRIPDGPSLGRGDRAPDYRGRSDDRSGDRGGYDRYPNARRGQLAVVPYGERDRTGVVISLDQFPPNSTVKIGAGQSLEDSIIFTSGQVGPDGTLKIDVPLPERLRRSRAIIVASTLDDQYRAYSDPITFSDARTADNRPSLDDRRRDDRPRNIGERRRDFDDSRRDDDDYRGHLGLGDDITVEGVVTPEGVRCPAIRNAEGRLFTLATTSVRVQPGDSVRVTGKVAPRDWCAQGVSVAVVSVKRGPVYDNSDRRGDEPRRDGVGYKDRDDRQDDDKRSDRAAPNDDHRLPDKVDNRRDGRLSDTFGGDRRNDARLNDTFDDKRTGNTETVRGVLTDESTDCTSVRAFDGTLYSIPARLTSIRLGERVELVGHRSFNQECRSGITFEVQDARRL